MANKLYEERDVARIAGRINSYTGLNKAYKLSEMADGVDEAAEAVAIEKDAYLAQYIERTIEELEIPEGVKTIGPYAFNSCNKLTHIKIPSQVLKILDVAFSDCKELESVEFSEGLTDIYVSAFYRCYKLKEAILPDSLTYLGNSAFRECTALKKVVLGINTGAIRVSPFHTCTALEVVEAKGNIKEIGLYAFQNCSACKHYDFSNNTAVPSLKDVSAFTGINSEARIFVPTELYDDWKVATNWSVYADHIVPVYKAPEIPDPGYVSEGLNIGEDAYAFSSTVLGRGSCTDSVIVIPDECTRIGENAFEGDTLIDTLILPLHNCWFLGDCFTNSSLRVIKNFTHIGSSFALYGAENLKIVTFYDGSSFGNFGLASLKAQGITYDFTRCTSVVDLEDVTYITVDEDTKILVPISLYDEWREATNWIQYADKIYPAK